GDKASSASHGINQPPFAPLAYSVVVKVCTGVCAWLWVPSLLWAEKGDQVLPMAAGAKRSRAGLWPVCIAPPRGFQSPHGIFAP
ncbi:hypothetical protein DBR06_SOUSAS3710142, partial [Sousa chinensis]